MFMEWVCLVMVVFLLLSHIFVVLHIFSKMMDFKKGPWCEIMDGLYWKFIEKNKNFFFKKPKTFNDGKNFRKNER